MNIYRPKRGRKTKRKFPRTETLKIRISKEHKQLIKLIRGEMESTIISDADIMEGALEHYGLIYALDVNNLK